MKLNSLLTAAVLCFAFAACNPKKDAENMKPDPHSYANFDKVKVTHLNLNLNVDFDKKVLSGKAGLSIENKSGSNLLILDTKDLTIEKVTLNDTETETAYKLDSANAVFGSALKIDIKAETKLVTVYYSTSPTAEAVQWLSPSQTSGGKLPYLFTQSQAILARTWIPLQDAPAVRFTYDATIKVPSTMLALMSAENPQTRNETGIYTFKMDKAIPSYLMALGVGDIVFKSLGETTGIYTEPVNLERYAKELEDTQKMVESAGQLYGPYKWGRYDLLVLPSSFPFGGMENPRLTFATPTIIAGDKSLVALVAHELAHSWSGNLVTNAGWNDFWLNEGFTTYFQQRIMEAVYGKDIAEMDWQLSLRGLKEEVESIGKELPNDTKLKLDLAGRNPDDGLTSIAYDKGAFFLRLCEESAGREKWDAFLKTYFESHAFGTMTTEGFVDYMNANLIGSDSSLAKKINYKDWIYGTGLPANCPQPISNRLDLVKKQAELFNSNESAASKLKTLGWTTQEWLDFLQQIPYNSDQKKLADLDKTFKFTQSGNSEILCEWFQHTIDSNYKPAESALENYLLSVGRRKLVKPLYTKLAATPEGKEWAKKVYEKARPGYHSVTFQTIDGILK